MILYTLAAFGLLFLLICALVVGWNFMLWFSQAVPYEIPAHELQRFVASWGAALGDRGRIFVRHSGTDRHVRFEKRLYKNRPGQLVLRCRNVDETRKYFARVQSAFAKTGIPFGMELTPTRKPRALRVEFSVEDPLMPSAAAHAASLALTAMGAPSDGPYEVHCEGRHRPDYTSGSVEVIPWTRGYRSGFRLGQAVARLLGKG